MYSAEQKIIPAKGKALVDTQISIAVPEGTYGRVAPRSGLGGSLACHVICELERRRCVYSVEVHDRHWCWGDRRRLSRRCLRITV
jgi:hypothetical protein